MKGIINKTGTILLGLLTFSNLYGQEDTIIQKKEIVAEYGYTVNIGDKIRDFTFNLVNGKVVSSKDWKGKVVMLQFNATWSGVCRKAVCFIENKVWLKYRRKSRL